ncbi:MAG: phosphotransferase [Dehalococcoidia bacterium]
MRDVLGAWGLAEASVEARADGSPHRHWTVRAAPGYLLRSYDERRTDEAVRYEHELLGYLAERSWPVAAPVVAADGSTVVQADGARWALFPLMPGETPPQDEEIYLQRRGALLALLHEDLDDAWPAERARDTFGRLDDLDTVARANGCDSFAAVVEHVRLVDDTRAETLAGLRERSAEALHLAGYARFPVTVIWGACTASHVLFQGDDVTALLDFDEARPDTRAVDIAAALRADAGGDGWRVHRWIAGYCAHATPPFHVIEANLVPVAMTAVALREATAALAAASAGGGPDAEAMARIDAAVEAEADEPELRRVIRTAAGHPSA